jgi:hypothetical protein
VVPEEGICGIRGGWVVILGEELHTRTPWYGVAKCDGDRGKRREWKRESQINTKKPMQLFMHTDNPWY